MIWVCVLCESNGNLNAIERKMNLMIIWLLVILDEDIAQKFGAWTTRRWVLQQDGDPKNESKASIACL